MQDLENAVTCKMMDQMAGLQNAGPGVWIMLFLVFVHFGSSFSGTANSMPPKIPIFRPTMGCINEKH